MAKKTISKSKDVIEDTQISEETLLLEKLDELQKLKETHRILNDEIEQLRDELKIAKYKKYEFDMAKEAQEKLHNDVTSDMTRNYKAVQEKYIKQINNLETELHIQRQELTQREEYTAKLREEKTEELRYLDEFIENMNNCVQDMCKDFQGILQNTLGLLQSKLKEIYQYEHVDESVAKEFVINLQEKLFPLPIEDSGPDQLKLLN